MPGAVSMMAEAAGFGTGAEATAKLFKAMENGEVKSADVLEKLAEIMAKKARQGDALAKAMDSTAAQQERFNNSVTDMIIAMSAAGADKGLANIFKYFTKFIEDNQGGIKTLGDLILRLSYVVEGTLGGLTEFGEVLSSLGTKLGLSNTALVGIGTSLLMLTGPFGQAILFAGAFLMVLDDLARWGDGRDSFFKDIFDGISSEKQDALLDIVDAYIKLSEAASKLKKTISEMSFDLGEGSALDIAFTFIGNRIEGIINRMSYAISAINNVLNGNFAAAGQNLADSALSMLPESIGGTSFFPDVGKTGVISSGWTPSAKALNNALTPTGLPSFAASGGNVAGASKQVIFGDFNVTFNGTPDQMMGSNYFANWLKGELNKTAVEVIGEH